MLEWIKEHSTILITIVVTVGFAIYAYGCEPKVISLYDKAKLVNRQELQLELDQLISISQLRMADLDKQEQLRSIVLQNALILVQGQPFNPLGLLTGIAAIYGISQGGSQVTKVVKNVRAKSKNSTG